MHIQDVLADPEYSVTEYQRRFGYRTVLSIPLLREGTTIGVFSLTRDVVEPFSDKQIELATTFADQAVIAIENTRLLNELRESLQQQTATSDVLKVISSSPGDLQPVFEAMLENATRICEAKFGNLFLYDGEAFRTAALYGAPPAWAEARRQNPVIRPSPGSGLARIAKTKQMVHIADIKAEPAYASGDPVRVALADLAGARTYLSVPMLKEDELVGAITIYRQEIRPFTDKQIELVTNFAAQAVIAIENTRLVNELRETLERQTATSEVLKVISASPGELQPVFNAMLENAVRICDAQFGAMHRFEGESFYAAAMVNLPPALSDFLRERGSAKAIPGSDMDNLYKSKQVVHTLDMLQARGSQPSCQARRRTDAAGRAHA